MNMKNNNPWITSNMSCSLKVYKLSLFDMDKRFQPTIPCRRKVLDPTLSFKPAVTISQGARGYNLIQMAQMTLGSGDLQQAVELPSGEDLNEWLAVNVISFYNEINVLYGVLTEFCTREACPIMSAGPKYEYLWADRDETKSLRHISAGAYIDFLMTWVSAQLNNELIFPTRPEVPFPSKFIKIVKIIAKRLFRVYAHIYHSHFHHLMSLELECHFNTSFKHFIFFVDKFALIETKELAPLAELIRQMKERRQKRT